MQPFFIAGLPRSRTAWLANFLSYGPSLCFHEPLACGLADSIAGYTALLEGTGTPYAGISCTGNAMFFEALNDLFPDARWVAVQRPFYESRLSMERIGYPMGDTGKLMLAALERVVKGPNTLTISFKKFNPRAVWEHCIPGEPLNVQRMDIVNRFNVTVHEEILKEEIRQGISKSRKGDVGWLREVKYE